MDGELARLLSGVGAVAIDGAKAVGKTATASRLAKRALRLDREEVAAVVRADPDAALRAPFPLFLDEWQRVAAVWDAVRRRVDSDDTPGLVLLAGSATPSLDTGAMHTGAGRIVCRRMRPLAISERLDAEDPERHRDTIPVHALLARGERPILHGESPWPLTAYAREIVATGFPALRSLPREFRDAQLDGYVQHLTTRDVQEVHGTALSPAAVRRWLQAFAAATGTMTSLDKLRAVATASDGTPSARTTVLRYRDALERLFIYDPVPGWKPGGTALSRLGEASKIHLVDPGLSAHLLGIDEDALLDGASNPLADGIPALRDGGLFGTLFESLVVQSMRTYAQANGVAHAHVRVHGGAQEVDGVLIRRDQRVVAYEVKLGAIVDDHDVRHLQWLKSRLGDHLLDALVITTGPAAYRRSDGIGVIPAAMLVP